MQLKRRLCSVNGTGLLCKLMIGSILGLTALSAFASKDLTALSAFTSKETIDILAYIDGRDLLVIQGPTLQWHHLDWAAVGRFGGQDEPTFINTTYNDHLIMDHFPWHPEWKEPSPDEMRVQALSSSYTFNTPLLPQREMKVTLTPISARNAIRINQQPTAANGYTLIVDFDDDPLDGPAWYQAKLTIEWNDNVPRSNVSR